MTAKPRCAARCGAATPCVFPVAVEIEIPAAGVNGDPDVIELCDWHGQHLSRLFGVPTTSLKESHPERVR